MSLLVLALGASGVLAAAGEPAPAPKRVTKETPVVSRIGTFRIGTLTVSPDGRRFAYARKEGKGWAVEVDGKVEATYKNVGLVLGPADIYARTGLLDFVGIKPMIFSADSRQLAYGAQEADSWVMVAGGRKGKPFKSVGSPVMSRDGQRLAHTAQVASGWCVVVDGTEGKAFEKVGPPAFSPDARRLAHAARRDGKEMIVVDGVPGKAYDSVDVAGFGAGLAFPTMVPEFPVFSADGRLAHHGKQAGKWHVVVEGQESEAFEEVSDIAFSPDGRRLAFPAKKAVSWTVMVDGQAQGSFQKRPVVVFSPDGKRLAVAVEAAGKQSVIVDGRTVGTHDAVSLPVFSPDGSRLAYAAKTGKQWATVIDGVTQKPYLAVSQVVFSPDGTLVTYEAAQAEGRWVVVVEGVEGKAYQGLVKGASVVFDDNTHLHYLVVYQSQILLVEEELQPGSGAEPPTP